MYQFKSAFDPTIRELATAISDRKIDRNIDIWNQADEIYSELGLGLTHSAKNRVGILNYICPLAYEVVKAEYAVLVEQTFYDKTSRNVYKPSGEKGGSPQQINIRIGGEYVDIFQMSPIVANSASFHIHSLYYDPKAFKKSAELDCQSQSKKGPGRGVKLVH